MEADKFKLFYVLLQVPATIVKHLNRVAQTGYDRLRLQVSGEGTDAAGQENEEQAVEEANEVGRRGCGCAVTLLHACPGVGCGCAVTLLHALELRSPTSHVPCSL